MEETRLNKYLSQAGICSRREADALIEAGRVRVNGAVAAGGSKVCAHDHVFVDGREVLNRERPVLLLFYKPKGLVCTASSKQSPNNVIDYLHYEQRVFTIGRLDKDSEGLLLLTNQGGLAYRLEKPNFEHEKEYEVGINRAVSDAFLKKMAAGVWLPELNVRTKPCEVRRISEQCFRIILKQGYNRQIRRMCGELGVRVRSLKRVRVANLTLDGLAVGAYREATALEERELRRQLGLEQ